MKPRQIDPDWALLFGFLVAPLICALNAALGDSVSGFKLGHFLMFVLQGYFPFSILTWPLGLMTIWLLTIWNRGQHHKARLFSLGCGVPIVVFWVWIAGVFGLPSHSPEIVGGLLLPISWSLGLLIFAFCARPPKP